VVLSSEQLEGVWYTWRPAKLIVVEWVLCCENLSQQDVVDFRIVVRRVSIE